jgi:enoyl-CoA hydratase
MSRTAGVGSPAVTSSPQLTLELPRPEVALVTLRRPERLNALSWELIGELHALLASLRGRDDVRVVVLTGEGRGFCSGLDIAGDDAVGSVDGAVEVYDRQELVASLATAIRDLPQPVIAAVNGPAAGGGLAIALAADIRICARSARFGVAFVRLGLSACDVGTSYMLPRIVGLGIASELMLTGRIIDADEASRVGLVNQVVDDGAVVDAALDCAQLIAGNAPFAVRMTKQVLARNCDAPSLEAAIELENRTQVLASRTEDMPEALAAFRERRPPRFAGR